MNEDQKLTALAAKAVGIEHPGGNHSMHDDGRLWDCKRLCWWNPIHDDGDALRLAVKLNIEVAYFDDKKEVNAGVWSPSPDSWNCMTPYNGKKQAATRRAIVRAAAEIGRAMP